MTTQTTTAATLPASVLTKRQKQTFRKELRNGDVITATVRYDDDCNNGHNSFAITGELYDRGYIRGEAHATNAAGRKRYLGSCGCLHEEIAKHFPALVPLLKWHLCSSDGPMHYVANTRYWVKEGNLEYARSSAVWPHAADEDLTQEGLEERLMERLPALMAEFKLAVESLGFTY